MRCAVAPMLLAAFASLPACAAPPASGPWLERAAAAQAIEVAGELQQATGTVSLRFRAFAPAGGSLEVTRRMEVFGQEQITHEAWLGDGSAIYALHAEKREAAWQVASWQELEILAEFPFLPPPWGPARPAGPPPICRTGADGALLRAEGSDESGAWSFSASAGRLLARARVEDFAQPLPAGYEVLGDPRNEFDHVRTLLEVGEYAPEITLIGLDGRERSLSEFRGRRLLLAFWFYH